MRKGWEYKKLGEVATFINGDRGKNYPSAKDFVESGVPFINTGHLNNGIINYDKMNYITINKYNSLGSGKIIKNDILFCLRGSLGKYAIVDGDSLGAIASSLVIIRPFQNADNRFIAHFLSTAKFKEYIIKNNNGSSQPNLSAKSVASFIIPLPPKSTQFSIVSELDKINELIRLKKEQLKDFDNLAQSIFYEMFGDPVENERGWEVKKLGEIYKMKSGESLSTKNFVEGDVPVYGGNGISGYHNQYNKDGSYIIIGRVGVYCGNARIVKGQFWLTDNAFELFYDKSIQNEVFVCKLLNLLNLRQYANAAAQPVISNNTLKHIPVPLPPLPLQHLFAQRIEQIEHQKAEVQKSITDLETLLASRMQYWFE